MAARRAKRKNPAKSKKSLLKKEYTEEEKARIANYDERSKKEPIKFKSMESDSGQPTIALQSPDDPLVTVKMLEALGTPDSNLQSHLLNQVIQTFTGIASVDGVNHDNIAPAANNAMAILAGTQPQDEIEGMLAVQMIGVHNLAMDALRRAMLGGQTFEGRKVNVHHATKMLKAFTLQVEALKKYRSRDQPKMTVGRVNVSQGGQAIVGTVNQEINKTPAQE